MAGRIHQGQPAHADQLDRRGGQQVYLDGITGAYESALAALGGLKK
jgi:hypothetical protein